MTFASVQLKNQKVLESKGEVVLARSKICLAVAATLVSGCLALAACSSDLSDASGSASATFKGSTSTSASPSSADTAPSTAGPDATAIDGAPVGVNELDPVPVGTAADFGDSITATLTASARIEAEGGRPGETGGPAIAVTVAVHNGSDTPVDLAELALTATYGKRTPAIENTLEPSDPLTGTLAPGEDRTGMYVFRVPSDQNDTVIVTAVAGFSANALQFAV